MKIKTYNAADYSTLAEACADLLSRYRYRIDEAGILVWGDVSYQVYPTTYSRPNAYLLCALASSPTDGDLYNDSVRHFDEPLTITVPKAA